MAREAYLRAVQDLPRVAEVTRLNALRELGLPPSREDCSLMMKYVERKMCLGDHRLLGQFAVMLAEAWSIGHVSQNEELMGLVSRMLYFVEQSALDGGRAQLGWLLAGWKDLPSHLFQSSKKRQSLQPFAALCSPTWVSGNLAYLKDLDYMESRLLAVNKTQKQPEADPDKEKQPPKPKKPAKKGKGDSKGKNSPPSGTQDPEA